mmetsp:Transcript_61898/g.71122  ORF Transcript_61898/g.71122 Transcript_61898/m.71122 type:complete len:246 (-) Transcript_61898:139-876(-)|eukprot:CAMPEP_0170802962 /NCGR_PEP_ID=MMETSP0733-20121128/29682_1 /TAXON_ID=186038 /ORGANISM="Fragilariopsis kerguelensis, Strain L26-C5" /LENGTH=245 /DNA_ID=CAMNT_0011156443 /DNA_START=51 /DNA_END=788 /DNA_ORIENTATION=-
MMQTKSKINSIAEWEEQKDETHYVLTAPREGWENPQIVYNFDLILRYDPIVVSEDHRTVDNVNGSSLPESQKYSWSQAKSTGSHKDNEIHGSFSIGAELGVKEAIKIPLIEETDFELKVTPNLTVGGSHSWGSEMSTTETVGVDTTINAAHGECIRVDCVISKNKFSVPYTLTKSTKGTAYIDNLPFQGLIIEGRPLKDYAGRTQTSYGVFHGTSGFSGQAVFTNVTPNMTNKFIRVGEGYEMVK